MKKRIIIIFLLVSPVLLWGSAQAESSGSATRGKYLAGRGIFIPPNEVHVDSYIAQIDYHYPEPEKAVGVSLFSGHRQLSSKGQEEVFQIGIQAKKNYYLKHFPQ